jgi:glycosyltransferase involved in cell wall biosynthesis
MMGAKSPLVSVLLPVYNGADYVADGVKSILAQSYDNFELIIINDGSRDDSAKIVDQFTDARIRAYHQGNLGLAATLNRGIQLARGKYLARQDQDDLSLPQRFQKQVAFLEAHEEYGMVGTWAEIRSADKTAPKLHSHPSESLALKFDLLFDNPFVHSSMMIRKTVIDRVGGYTTDKARQPPEDYELWSRVARNFEVANIPEVLHIYRDVPSSMSKGAVNPFLENVMKISAENFSLLTGRDKNDPGINNLVALSHAAYHKVIGRPSLPELSSALVHAAERLCRNCHVPPSALSEKVHWRIDNLRNHFLQWRRETGTIRKFKDFVRGIKRVVVR